MMASPLAITRSYKMPDKDTPTDDPTVPPKEQQK